MVTVSNTVDGYDDSFTTKLKASPAGGAQMKIIVTVRWINSATMGVRKGRFCMTTLGRGAIPSLPSSWITRAATLSIRKTWRSERKAVITYEQ